ncbi:type II secretion system F family protein [Synechococcus sp. ATX 2A4]|uniref:type II secretion system F family protein n=1 Tax=Synechococcus sp. ATX 2A4 TaxID=2823727 RepID=UPI0020CE69EE|nr:type II secretion system F family protein [Synechococcus sp. ATX 2A4]MCP9885461.1 type II secretion system F family protein [Synechococcus sp. ATX 2A4]
MASFLATYTTSKGQSKELRVSAVDLATARRDLRKRGILPTNLQAVSSSGSSSTSRASASAAPATARSTPTNRFIATYRGRDGKPKDLKLAATDMAGVRSELRRRGITATKVVQDLGGATASGGDKPQGGSLLSKEINLGPLLEKSPGVRDKALFANKLAALVDSGVPIVRSLILLANQQKNPVFKRSLKAISLEVSQGETMGSAMRKWPKVFDRLSIALIEAGEVGGVLDESLKRLSMLLEQTSRLQNQIKGALGYPVAVLVIAVAVFLGMTIFLIPTFAGIFEQLGADLPPFTQLMVDLSALLRSPFSIYLTGAIILIAILFGKYYKTPIGRRQVDAAILKLPLFGDLIQKTSTAQFCRTFSSLSRAGVPILQALEIVRDTVGNSVLSDAIDNCRGELQNGVLLSVALSRKRVFPEMMLSMLVVGEETGEMDSMLSKVADFYEDEVTAAVKALTSLLEPIMIVIVGIIVASILLAMYLPMFSVFEKIR